MAYYRAVARADAAAAPAPGRIGVLAVNLGTPDAPSYFAVQRYLREFLSDRRVINTSRLIWSPLLYAAILPFRPLRTARKYRKIWLAEGSPLAVYSKRLAAKSASALQADWAIDTRRTRHDLRQSEHCRRPAIVGRARHRQAAGAALVPSILFIDHRLGFRSHQPRLAALAVAAGDPFRQ